jgi:hypothetical protein
MPSSSTLRKIKINKLHGSYGKKNKSVMEQGDLWIARKKAHIFLQTCIARNIYYKSINC